MWSYSSCPFLCALDTVPAKTEKAWEISSHEQHQCLLTRQTGEEGSKCSWGLFCLSTGVSNIHGLELKTYHLLFRTESMCMKFNKLCSLLIWCQLSLMIRRQVDLMKLVRVDLVVVDIVRVTLWGLTLWELILWGLILWGLTLWGWREGWHCEGWHCEGCVSWGLTLWGLTLRVILWGQTGPTSPVKLDQPGAILLLV